MTTFPASPTNGDPFVNGAGETVTFDGVGWEGGGSGAAAAASEGLYAESAATVNVDTNTVVPITDLTVGVVNDFGSGFSGGTFTVPTGKDGWYSISASFNCTGSPNQKAVYIVINGANVTIGGDNNTGGNAFRVGADTQYKLAAGDTVAISGEQNSGATQTVTSASLSLVHHGAA